MKKFTFLAVMAATVLSASAQYTLDTPYAEPLVKAEKVGTVYLLQADASTAEGFEKAGVNVVDCRVNDETNFLYVWSETFVGGDATVPGVGYADMQFDGYVSFNVTNVGWSGAGWFQTASDFSEINDETRLHLCVLTNNNIPTVGFKFGEKDGLAKVALFSVGAEYNDNGTVFPVVASTLNDDWTTVDISFADLKKLNPDFDFAPSKDWKGNVMAVLAGGVEGKNLCIDAMYMYNAPKTAVEEVATEATFVVSDNTVTALGANAVALYALDGKLVKSVAGNTLSLRDLQAGVYVAKAGNKTAKVLVK